MVPNPDHDGIQMRPQRLSTPTSDDVALQQDTHQRSAELPDSDDDDGADFSMRRRSVGEYMLPNMLDLSLRVLYQHTSDGGVPRPPTPPCQEDEECRPRDHGNDTSHPYESLSVGTPRRPGNVHLQPRYASGSILAPSATQNQIDDADLSARLPSVVEPELQSETGPSQAVQSQPDKSHEALVQNRSTYDVVGRPDKPVGPRKTKLKAHMSIEEETLVKQEIYRQKGERKRQQIQERQKQKAEAMAAEALSEEDRTDVAESTSTSDDEQQENLGVQSTFEDCPLPTRTPYRWEGGGMLMYSSRAGTSLGGYRSQAPLQDGTAVSSYYDTQHDHHYPSAHVPNTTHQRTPYICAFPLFTPTPPLAPTHQPLYANPTPPHHHPYFNLAAEPIPTDYPDYKHDITLYALNPAHNFPYAQSFLDALLSTTLKAYKWHAHSSRGFIQHGTHLSLLVLHNAANPFSDATVSPFSSPFSPTTPPPTTTTTIGVYGRYWYTHQDIHWITLSPSIPHILHLAQSSGLLAHAHTWSCSDTHPARRRFHRAYWLAARGY
ncbi:predicted protein [Plenodomus lingam JN3]|uniref:Predicted protein n=1 Tax=Leptosphaeria maculans (strain JN3 / isolate v23.1.3 / race Av1-4-5-6-7-8) TaxID=985895 RepID=E4ZQX7_LEPMJ|nr:predicted protein [Plenodomus lingam JN3]CBX94132.1 predicted protein [Plenodomus lingam JN3]